MAVEGGDGLTKEEKAVLTHYNAIVYEISHDLCSKATDSIFCGSEDERAPASVFRYFFYEKWAMNYNTDSLLMLADFRDVVFQSDPFAYHTDRDLGDIRCGNDTAGAAYRDDPRHFCCICGRWGCHDETSGYQHYRQR